VLVECVGVVAAAYLPGISAEQQARADSAVARLVQLLGLDPDEATASRIGLLVQACESTGGLIANALRLALQLPPSCAEGWPVEALVNETLRYDSPIRNTHRHALPGAALNGRPLDAGTGVLLDLDAANRDPAVFDDPHRFDPGRRARSHPSFGHGLRPCPGANHELALASGVIETVLPQAALARADIRHRQYPNLRVPTRLEVIIR
jgi:cytochrome P450